VEAPENTLAAFRKAWAVGVDGVELDVRLSREGVPVVFHDEDGSRLCGIPFAVSDSAWADMVTWRVGGEPIPRLESIVDAHPAGSMLLVEIKSGVETVDVLNGIRSTRNTADITVLTFSPHVAMRAASSGWPTWINVEPEQQANAMLHLPTWRDAGVGGVSFGWSERISREWVERVHRGGMSFAVWTINQSQLARQMEALGVDVLMTDHPRLVQAGAES